VRLTVNNSIMLLQKLVSIVHHERRLSKIIID